MHLWLLYRTACGWGNCSGCPQKPAKPISPRADHASKEKQKQPSARGAAAEVRLTAAPVTRWPAAQRRFSGCQASSLMLSGWIKGRGSSPKGAGAFSAHFWASKSGPAGGMPANKKKKSHSAAGGPAAKGKKKCPSARGATAEVRLTAAPVTRRPAARQKISPEPLFVHIFPVN